MFCRENNWKMFRQPVESNIKEYRNNSH
jgi:hypothetical protein